MQFQKLGLHSYVLPMLEASAAAQEQQNDTMFDSQLEDLKCATIFDCTKLPLEFVSDTGQAEWHEAEQTQRDIRLPFPVCYFEFPDESGILAMEVEHHEGEVGPSNTEVSFWAYAGWGIWDLSDPDTLGPGFGQFANGSKWDDDEESVPFYNPVNGGNPATEALLQIAGEKLLGVLALMNDRLLASEVRPDPAPKLSASRIKRGRLPLSAETRVLTINTGAVRRATHAPKGKHESPRLHWRRGHWRVNHRGSEFETKGWVRRCLVGDPARGAIHKDYRVVWNQPMLQAHQA